VHTAAGCVVVLVYAFVRVTSQITPQSDKPCKVEAEFLRRYIQENACSVHV
jgi:hypothetical protein